MFRFLLIAALCWLTSAVEAKSPGTAQGISVDETFLQLREAARNFDVSRTQQLAKRIPKDYPLAIYADFWAFRTRFVDRKLEDTGNISDKQVREFLAKYEGTFPADRIRNDWLLILGKRRDFKTFDEQFPLFILQDDGQLTCYALLSKLSKGELITEEARAHLNKSAAVAGTEGCTSLVIALAGADPTIAVAQHQLWSPAEVWGRIRLLQEGNQRTAAKRLLAALPKDQQAEPLQLDFVLDSSSRFLSTRGTVEGRLSKELTVLALAQMAREDSTGVNEGILNSWLKRLPANDARFIRLQYAAACAKRLGTNCNSWLTEVDATDGSEETFAWAARAALRMQDWKALARVLAAMGAEQFQETSWTYWNARTLKALGAPREQWASVLGRISKGFDFYALLAREELGESFVVPTRAANTVGFTEEDVQEAARSPHAIRAFKFYELNLRFEGNREWNWQLRNLSDTQLAAYAELGRRVGHLDRMVNTAERTRQSHDFLQRFPTPFIEQLKPIAQPLGLDLAWVYGLIRQESRFIMNARSSVGASGLMQLMPATARFVAKKIGMEFDAGRINELEKNLTLGANYLAMVHNDLENSPPLATAAYNAGPGRPRNWRSTLAHTVEGAIFAETIPFTETRTYVKNVLANATIYAALIGQSVKSPSLKERLGLISPQSAGKSRLP